MLLRFCLASGLRTTLSCFEAGELLQIENANAATLVGGQAFAMQQEGLPVAVYGETLASNGRTTVLKRYQLLRRVSPSGARGPTGIDGVSTALSGMRMSIEIGAENVAGQQSRDLSAIGEAPSPVECTLGNRRRWQ